VSAHESSELVNDIVQQTETVVLSERGKEVLEDVALVGTGNLLELRDDGLLVGGREGRGGDDAGELGVGLKGSTEVVQGLGGSVEGGRLGGGSVLFARIVLINMAVHLDLGAMLTVVVLSSVGDIERVFGSTDPVGLGRLSRQV
jgi:hypothetical protein